MSSSRFASKRTPPGKAYVVTKQSTGEYTPIDGLKSCTKPLFVENTALNSVVYGDELALTDLEYQVLAYYTICLHLAYFKQNPQDLPAPVKKRLPKGDKLTGNAAWMWIVNQVGGVTVEDVRDHLDKAHVKIGERRRLGIE